MAKTFYTDLDLNRNKLLNGVIHPSATPPTNPDAGQIYFDTDAKKLKYFDGNAWMESGGGGTAGVTSLGGATGAITLNNSSGLAIQGNILRVKYTNYITNTYSGLDINSNKIDGTDPSNLVTVNMLNNTVNITPNIYTITKTIQETVTELDVEFRGPGGSVSYTRDNVLISIRNSNGVELDCVKEYGYGAVKMYFDSGLPAGTYYIVAVTTRLLHLGQL